MILEDLSVWAKRLKLEELEWGMTWSQTEYWAQKKSQVQKKLILTNWIADYDFFYKAKDTFGWDYYYRKLNSNRLKWEWYKFLAFWRLVKWDVNKRLLLFTDSFDDYPILRHLAKQTNEDYSVGWYPGLGSNRSNLKHFRQTRLIGKVELEHLPTIIITFSLFYPISTQFLKEFTVSNIYYVCFVDFGDTYVPGAYLVFLTKSPGSFYFYYHMVRKIIFTSASDVPTGLQLTTAFCSVSQKFKVRNKKLIKKNVTKRKLHFLYWQLQVRKNWRRKQFLNRKKWSRRLYNRTWRKYAKFVVRKTKKVQAGAGIIKKAYRRFFSYLVKNTHDKKKSRSREVFERKFQKRFGLLKGHSFAGANKFAKKMFTLRYTGRNRKRVKRLLAKTRRVRLPTRYSSLFRVVNEKAEKQNFKKK